jgi:hypothetical protein
MTSPINWQIRMRLRLAIIERPREGARHQAVFAARLSIGQDQLALDMIAISVPVMVATRLSTPLFIA